MTMRIVIENTDQHRKARIVTRMRTNGELAPQPSPIELPPGGKAEVWIHDGKDVVVEEV